MQSNKLYFIFFSICFILMGCYVEQKPINYGQDACFYCKMNIVDKQHAAEIVTKKGKVFKYDAIECLLNDKPNNSAEKTALFLVMDFNNPNVFLDANNATFLISKNIPSPMNGYLSAFNTNEEALKKQEEKEGELFSWEEIRKVSFK